MSLSVRSLYYRELDKLLMYMLYISISVLFIKKVNVGRWRLWSVVADIFYGGTANNSHLMDPFKCPLYMFQ